MNNKKQRRKPFCHLNQSYRDRIQALLDAGHLQKEIAQIVQVDKGTVSREIAKHQRKNGRYEATTAQHKARVKRLNSKYQGMKVEEHPDLKGWIIAQLILHRSPDEMAGRMKKERWKVRVSKNAIYK